MVKLRILTLSQNGAFAQLSKDGQKHILGGTTFPPITTTPSECPPVSTSVTKPYVPTSYPYTPTPSY